MIERVADPNANHKITCGQTRIVVIAAFEEEMGWIPGGRVANSDTDIEKQHVHQIAERISLKLGRRVILKRPTPRYGWKISTLVGYIHANQESFEIIDTDSTDNPNP